MLKNLGHWQFIHSICQHIVTVTFRGNINISTENCAVTARLKSSISKFRPFFFAKSSKVAYDESMPNAAYDDLNAKEKEVLRLILQGHDAKTAALEADVTPNVINERLRSARKKLNVTSSKAAARILADHEEIAPKFIVPKQIGIVSQPTSDAVYPLPEQQVASSDGNRVMELQATYESTAGNPNPFLSMPFRKQGEMGNELSKNMRLMAIADLSVKIAFAFAFVCLAAMLVSNLINPA